jgi:hypothetical protein
MKQRTKIKKRVVANSRRCRTQVESIARSFLKEQEDKVKHQLDELMVDAVMAGEYLSFSSGSCLDSMMNAMGWHWVETRSIPEPTRARSPYTPEDGENHG